MMTKERKRSIACLVLVLLAFTLYSLLLQQGVPTLRFSAENRRIVLQGARKTECRFSFDTIEEIRLVEMGNYGEAAGGGETALGGYLYGTWTKDGIGSYEAYVRKQVPVAILIRDGEKTALLNSENSEVTRNLAEQLIAFRESISGAEEETKEAENDTQDGT